MKDVKITNWQGKEIKGKWNEKFYDSQLEDKTLVRIYIDNQRWHITKEEQERLIKEISQNKIDEDNYRIGIIIENFMQLDNEAREMLIDHLKMNKNQKIV